MLTRHVALVSTSKNVKARQLMAVAAALQKQATRDFGPIWSVAATVDPFERLDDVPLGHWPIIVADDIETPGAAGIHEDRKGQPFALVQAGPLWSLTASHECLEMLADPMGRRTVGGFASRDVPKEGEQVLKYPVEFLVEVCDPCEDLEFAYHVEGIPVSDFYTPEYFDAAQNKATRYDFVGHITEPRQVLKNGYLSWYDPGAKSWFQHTRFEDKESIGQVSVSPTPGSNLRVAIDQKTPTPLERLSLATGKERLEELVNWMALTACPILFCRSTGQALAASLSAGRILADRGGALLKDARLKPFLKLDAGMNEDAKEMEEDIASAKTAKEPK